MGYVSIDRWEFREDASDELREQLPLGYPDADLPSDIAVDRWVRNNAPQANPFVSVTTQPGWSPSTRRRTLTVGSGPAFVFEG
jgi:hypothetical protein